MKESGRLIGKISSPLSDRDVEISLPPAPTISKDLSPPLRDWHWNQAQSTLYWLCNSPQACWSFNGQPTQCIVFHIWLLKYMKPISLNQKIGSIPCNIRVGVNKYINYFYKYWYLFNSFYTVQLYKPIKICYPVWRDIGNAGGNAAHNCSYH